MTSYYVGDIPAEPIVVEPVRGVDADPIDLADFDELDTIAQLRNFDGELVTDDFAVTFEAGSVVLEWPSGTTPFPEAGAYQLNITLVGTDARERLAPFYYVAQDDSDGWHTIDSVRAEWEDAAVIPDIRLHALLEVAKQQIIAFAPVLADGARPPMNYREGQKIHARNMLNAGRATGDGEGEFDLAPHPLDWHVEQLLRPKTPRRVVG